MCNPPATTYRIIIVDMADTQIAAAGARLGDVFEQAGTPQELKTFIVTTLKLTTVPDLLGYVIRKEYEQEWRDIVAGAFPVSGAVAARAATADAGAVVGKWWLLCWWSWSWHTIV